MLKNNYLNNDFASFELAKSNIVSSALGVALGLTSNTTIADISTKISNIVNNGAKTASLNCGGSYTIPAGYHNGSGKITANSAASQNLYTKTQYDSNYNTGYNAGVAAGQANPTLMSNTFVALDYSSLITSQSNGLKSDRTAVLVKVKGKSKVSISCWESGDNIQIRGVFILSTGAISSLVSGASVSVPSNALYLLMRGSYSNAHLYSISIS